MTGNVIPNPENKHQNITLLCTLDSNDANNSMLSNDSLLSKTDSMCAQ
jgi:hypothetical protein